MIVTGTAGRRRPWAAVAAFNRASMPRSVRSMRSACSSTRWKPISGVTAAAVAFYWSRALYGRVAGRPYLAWCAAAVVLPIVAGRLFDLTHGYGMAVLIAAAANALGALVALGLPRQGSSRSA